MAKKDFTGINTGRLYDQIAQATADPEDAPAGQTDQTPAADPEGKPAGKTRKERRTYNPEDAEKYIQEGRTSGRKGLKLDRINVAFTPENYEYVLTMAQMSGQTLTGFVNTAIKQHREANKELYEGAKALKARIEGREE